MLDCIKATGLKNEQIAVECGVAAPTSFNWTSGKTKKIKAEPLLKAAKLFGVTPEWLATGKQPKYPPDGSQPILQSAKATYLIGPKQDKMTTELVDLFSQLDKASKHEYLGQLRGFVMGRSVKAKDPPAEQSGPATMERTGTHA
jgi:transcriptional regulator with XRE-family HTH domain